MSEFKKMPPSDQLETMRCAALDSAAQALVALHRAKQVGAASASRGGAPGISSEAKEPISDFVFDWAKLHVDFQKQLFKFSAERSKDLLDRLQNRRVVPETIDVVASVTTATLPTITIVNCTDRRRELKPVVLALMNADGTASLVKIELRPARVYVDANAEQEIQLALTNAKPGLKLTGRLVVESNGLQITSHTLNITTQ